MLVVVPAAWKELAGSRWRRESRIAFLQWPREREPRGGSACRQGTGKSPSLDLNLTMCWELDCVISFNPHEPHKRYVLLLSVPYKAGNRGLEK